MVKWCDCAPCGTIVAANNSNSSGGGDMAGDVADKAAFEARYSFVKTLGDGGQGGVYKFQRRDNGEMVAVKEWGCLTSREWRILSSVRHPHICSLVDRTRYENPHVRVTKIVMEIMDTSLQSFMMRGEKRDKLDPARDRFDVETCRELLYPVALALDYLHHKLIVHLDVKLDNIMIRLDPHDKGRVLRDPVTGRLAVKLADFGLAIHLGGDPCGTTEHQQQHQQQHQQAQGPQGQGKGENGMGDGNGRCGGGAGGGSGLNNSHNNDGMGHEQQRQQQQQQQEEQEQAYDRERRFLAAGTNHYMAPEVEFDSRFGVQADIFSLGVVLHVMLAGRFPKTALHAPAAIDAGIPDVDGLRGLLASMLHGDPYQRPHCFEVLDHPFLRPLRRPGDTLLGDLDGEAEQGGRVMLLQIRRGEAAAGAATAAADTGGGGGGGGSGGSGGGGREEAIPPPPPPPPVVPRSSSQGSTGSGSSTLALVQQEERPLDLYVAYMDLAEIDDPRSTVVVCGRKAAMQRVKKSEASTLGAILVRERAPSATEFGQLFEVAEPECDGSEGSSSGSGDDDDDAMEGQEPPPPPPPPPAPQPQPVSSPVPSPARPRGSPGSPPPSPMRVGRPALRQIVRKSGRDFEYLRSLWVALVDDGTRLGRESIWRVYQDLRRLAPQMLAEANSVLYLPMTACDDRVDGFSSARFQRQAVIQESVGLAQYLARALPSRQLESVVLYTWQKDAMRALMDFTQTFRRDFHGMMPARLDEAEYRRCVGVLRQAAADSPALAGDAALAAQLAAMEGLDTYPAVCVACQAAGAHVAARHAAQLAAAAGGGAGPQAVAGAMEVLQYNLDKARFEEREKGAGGEEAALWVDMVGHYDAIRSLHTLLSLLRVFG